MKKCPYCAEEIQDEAIKCRFCGSDLRPEGGAQRVETQAYIDTPSAQSTQAIQFTHSGHRYLLGYGADFFGMWDRLAPGPPVSRFPRTQEGWRAAWQQYVAMEPGNVDARSGVPPQVIYAAQPQQTNGMAVASLVLGILWVWWIGSVLALIFGYSAKSEIDRSRGGQGGRGLAVAGIVLGWVGIGTFLLFVIGLAAARSSFG